MKTRTEILSAIAYLKVSLPDSDESPAIKLNHADTPVTKDLGNGLLVAYLYDTGDRFEYIHYRDIEEKTIGEDELHLSGLRNLYDLAIQSGLRIFTQDQIFIAELDGNFEASLLLLDTLWTHSFKQFVTGDYLVTIPCRHTLAFCDASSQLGRQQLLEMIEKLKPIEDHPLTNQLFIRTAEEWSPVMES